MTRKQWEAKVLKQVADEGGFSIFWVTCNQFIPHAVIRLAKRGRIARDGIAQYPWIAMKIVNRCPKARQK